MMIIVVKHMVVLCWQCDGQDFTVRIRELKFHCLLFLNIPKFVFMLSV